MAERYSYEQLHSDIVEGEQGIPYRAFRYTDKRDRLSSLRDHSRLSAAAATGDIAHIHDAHRLSAAGGKLTYLGWWTVVTLVRLS